MVGHIVFACIGALCLVTGGFVGGLTWSSRELGAAEHRATGVTCCAVFGVLGLACLGVAGAVV